MFARVTVVPNSLEAEMICGLLRTEGIDCFTRPTDNVGAAYAAAGGPQEVVVIRDDDLPRARELVEASRRR
jgi:Putative prokaryotic signal transducing protein